QFLRIEKGSLRGLGIKSWRTKISFTSPVRVTCRYNHLLPKDAGSKVPFTELSVSVCDDGRDRRINCGEMAALRAIDTKAGFCNDDQGKALFTFNTPCELTLESDGKTARLSSPDYSDRQVACGNISGGAIAL